MRTRAAVASVAVAAIVALAACGGGQSRDTGTGSSTVTIWTSLPLQGPERAASTSIVNAQRLALEESGGRIGDFTVKLNVRDDASAPANGWDPDQVSGNARRAVQDKSTIAYIGELDWEASAISIPILNEVGVLQISPGSTYTGLTTTADKGEPEKYYPGGMRTFGRVLPTDAVQARAQVAYQREIGCRALFSIGTRPLDAASLARNVADGAAEAGIAIAGQAEADPNASDYAELAAEVAASGADCAFVAWTGTDADLQLLDDLNAQAPELQLFASATPIASDLVARLGPEVARRLRITSPVLPFESHPPAARRFRNAYVERFREEPHPYAIFGYESMKLALLAIDRAGAKGNDREAVIEAFFEIRDRDSVLGTYSIDANGDTSLRAYGGYRAEAGTLAFESLLEPSER